MAAASLRDDGYARFGREAFSDLPETAAYARLAAAWDDLEADPYAPAAQQDRFRRYGRLLAEFEPGGPAFTPLPHVPFRQDAALIPIHEGRSRLFAAIDDSVLLDDALLHLVGVALTLARTDCGAARWNVGLHMVRVVTDGAREGLPTPEGRHRDGHDYVGMHLLRRTCRGGHTTIHRDGHPPTEFVLRDALDSVVVNDHRLTHEVSPIHTSGGPGIRDTLLIDMNRADRR